jgi:hypothetical protein
MILMASTIVLVVAQWPWHCRNQARCHTCTQLECELIAKLSNDEDDEDDL